MRESVEWVVVYLLIIEIAKSFSFFFLIKKLKLILEKIIWSTD